jgi:hypothetical protein
MYLPITPVAMLIAFELFTKMGINLWVIGSFSDTEYIFQPVYSGG